MSANEWDEYAGDVDGDSDLVKNLRKQLRSLSKTNGELTTENAGFKTQSRKQSVAAVLKSRGVNEKVSTFYPSDADTSEEAVGKWLDDFGDVFGATAPAATDGGGQTPTVDAEGQRAMERINGADSSGTPPAGEAAVIAAIEACTTQDQLDALLAKG